MTVVVRQDMCHGLSRNHLTILVKPGDMAPKTHPVSMTVNERSSVVTLVLPSQAKAHISEERTMTFAFSPDGFPTCRKLLLESSARIRRGLWNAIAHGFPRTIQSRVRSMNDRDQALDGRRRGTKYNQARLKLALRVIISSWTTSSSCCHRIRCRLSLSSTTYLFSLEADGSDSFRKFYYSTDACYNAGILTCRNMLCKQETL
ncbi:hypothetical protein DFJ77DRAFT_242774 [Powellomyces hirtus]|nr:hypothetical protein DFJ77DRAFT_242774 [Powellomyces hirtus]